MARRAEFKPKQTNAGWMVSCPPSLSESGKRERHFFKNRDLARDYAANLKERVAKHGSAALTIKPSMAEDASKAAEILEPYSITLEQAARFYKQHHDRRAKVPTLDEAWEAGLWKRQNRRTRTLTDLRKWQRALPDWFMQMNCYEIGPDDISNALNEVTSGPTHWAGGLRYISSIFGDLKKSGKLDKNPASHVLKPDKPESGDVVVYSVKELKNLLKACKDYPKGEADRLCKACAVPFAFMAFAGIRPDETAKLKWEDVKVEKGLIRVGGRIAKKKYIRNVRIQPTLQAWIDTVPPEDRKGSITPPRWERKAAKVRKKAGIDGHEKQDALRHSFGSYLFATENDLNALKLDMGHGHENVFFEHYRTLIDKADALPYWQVLPKGAKKIKTIHAA